MTPYSTRSRSPDPDCPKNTITSLLAQDPSSSLDSLDSKNKFIERLLELSHHSSSSSVSTVGEVSSPVLEHLESHDSHMTILMDSGSREEAVLCSVSFTHASSVFDIEDDGERSSGSSEQTLIHEEVRTRQKTSKDITNLYIGEMELEIPSDGEDLAVDFEVKSSSPSLHEEDGDSGCATSIGSPDKTAPTLDFSRPGMLHLPRGLLQEGNGGDTRREELSESNMECISDNAELQSQFSSSCVESEEHQKKKEKVEETDEGKDEWPDLFADNIEFNYPHSPAVETPLPPLQPVNHPPTNGYIHPTPPPPFPPPSASGSGKNDFDPALWMATINSHIRQQQQAVYQQHANLNAMMYSGYPIGPPPLPPPQPTPPPHPAMFSGPTSFPGFYPPPPLPPNGPPPPPPFPPGPGYTPIPPPPMAPNGEFLPPPQHPPIHHTLPLSQSPSASNSEDTQGESFEDHIANNCPHLWKATT